ncbi:alpha/beta hydrolase [Pseudomonas sp. AKS31]|uniref:alpha/beta hydrolase n=1 Tax=Pseudomonas sp. AKS31 TaxID=2949091 RepID=UPI00202ABC98|nr:alpha/beta hydrolase [Pseudomonas sp. AKS31]MCL9798483.1 alpha/beta hydrolase [Pseudomonas sp. AKS31]
MINRLALTSASRFRSRLQFDEAPTGPEFFFAQTFSGYQLEGRVLANSAGETSTPKVLAIHGARSDYSRLNAILYPLQALGIASLSFNLSGHNPSADIALENTSLTHNLQEALQFAGHLGAELRTVIGHSLGGALALKVAQAHRASVRRIVLFCPALYPEAAWQQPFGQPFKRAISVPYGFLDSPSLDFLSTFEGEVLLVIGEYDGLQASTFGGVAGTSVGTQQMGARAIYSAIPHEVIEAIEKSLAPRQFRRIVLPGCDHAVSTWLRENPPHAVELANEIARFINAGNRLQTS